MSGAALNLSAVPAATVPDEEGLVARLPQVRGRYRPQADLSRMVWFQAGGVAEVLFKPEDTADLSHFLSHKPADVPVTVLGVGSNLLVRDGGVEGVVIRLGREFTHIDVREDGTIRAGAAAMGLNVATVAAEQGRAGLEFLSGIPGTVGGALAMNAGAYGNDTASVLISATAVDEQGIIHTLPVEEMGYRYRHCGVPSGWVFTEALFRTTSDAGEAIHARMQAIRESREASQPVRSRTGGSTFKNPEGGKAWECIDRAGCRGLTIGGAQVSEKHCNFLINTGNATAEELELLGEEVRRRVLESQGVTLEWEIRRIGRRADEK
jgi:UDP-N-acetylmuramate dehydrogenase